MGNKKKSSFFVRFIGNKNTVTILGVIGCIITLVVGYYIRINNNAKQILIPYAKENINSRTLITAEMVGQLRINQDYLSTASNVIKKSGDIVNSRATYKSSIPANSIFYKEMIKQDSEMPDEAWRNIPDGQTIFSLDVSKDSTYGGQVHAGEYIDLYLSTTTSDENNSIIFALLVKSIRILEVKDSSGNNIIEGSGGIPSELLFAVPEDIFLTLSRATFLGMDIIPVIRNRNYTLNKNETEVPIQQLIDYIDERVERLG